MLSELMSICSLRSRKIPSQAEHQACSCLVLLCFSKPNLKIMNLVRCFLRNHSHTCDRNEDPRRSRNQAHILENKVNICLSGIFRNKTVLKKFFRLIFIDIQNNVLSRVKYKGKHRKTQLLGSNFFIRNNNNSLSLI